jgi:hypothetical protein
VVFNVSGAGNPGTGTINNSVVLSLDGKKVAYVLNTNPAVLHVLTLGTGTVGNICDAASGHSDTCWVGNPATPGDTTAAPGSSLATVTLTGATSVTNSSVFADYVNDIGYVGDDVGHLFAITGLFKGTPALASGWPKTLAGTLTAPVVDVSHNVLFVGSTNGNLYGFSLTYSGSPTSPTATAFTTASVALGCNACTTSQASPPANTSMSIVDPPLVDVTSSMIYAFYGSGSGSNGTIANKGGVSQVPYTTTTFTTAGIKSAVLGPSTAATIMPVYDGGFNNFYWTQGTITSQHLYVCGEAANGTAASNLEALYSIGFTKPGSVPVMNTTATQVGTIETGGSPLRYCTPLTEFYNTSTTVDWLFMGLPQANAVWNFDITAGDPTCSGGQCASNATAATVVGGPSGIIVDGADSSIQASSIYFSSLGYNGATCTNKNSAPIANPPNIAIGPIPGSVCAYKLTQSGLK